MSFLTAGGKLLTTNNSLLTYSPLKIGDIYQGGMIVYIDGTGLHGMIAAQNKSPQGGLQGTYTWGTSGVVSGAVNNSYGGGNQNTIDLYNKWGVSGYAYYYCYSLVLSGYSDWFLPNRTEIRLVYAQRVKLGFLPTGASPEVWQCSNSLSSPYCGLFDWSNGGDYGAFRNEPGFVIPCRYF
jgi:hypothetical protein